MLPRRSSRVGRVTAALCWRNRAQGHHVRQVDRRRVEHIGGVRHGDPEVVLGGTLPGAGDALLHKVGANRRL